jgi:ATP-dependent RNA helicase HelY
MATPFRLDPFQLRAIAALDQGYSVLVSAPTGSGKTVVADAAIDMALHAGGRAIYTTPVKALSNQKFSDLRSRLGTEAVGLLTGDVSIAGDSSVVVMTTEVLRNMMYASSPDLDRVHVVVLDEVHYLQDSYRGPVWEEVIIGLPEHVRLVCLSATVSNAVELGEWIGTVRGQVATIVEHERPTELTPLYLVGDKTSETDHLVDVLIDGRPNPEAVRFDQEPRGARRGGGPQRRRFMTPRRLDVVDVLSANDMLPAIYFIFSRNACDDALAQCRDAGERFTTSEEAERIVEIVEQSTMRLSDSDLDALGYDLWLEALRRGIAAHHAGLVPPFKEAVERCFVEGLVKVVFATETLALGINMPARSVVIEKLSKFNGDTHEFLTPSQFTQLTGRAGRRGIDDIGYAVVLWSPFVSFHQVAELAGSRDFPLGSAFRPTYNMAANLIRRYDRESAMAILGQSFAQFQSNRELVLLERRLATAKGDQAALRERSTCELGDVGEYHELRQRLKKAARGSAPTRVEIERAMALLRPGEVIVPSTGDVNEDRAQVVLSVAYRGRGALRVKTVDFDGGTHQLTPVDLGLPPRRVAEVVLPSPFAPNDPEFLRAVVDSASHLQIPAPTHVPQFRHERAKEALERHPVHQCPDRELHLDALSKLQRMDREIESRERQLRRRSGSIIARFDAVMDVLASYGCVENWQLTELGERLASIYHESDLLLSLALGDGTFDDLDPASLAAVVSALTFEERRPGTRETSPPTPLLAKRFTGLLRRAESLAAVERQRGLAASRLPEPGFMSAVYRWAQGADLAALIDDDMSGGDFVRNVKVVIDLLSQIAEAAPLAATRSAAHAATDLLRRGVVAVDVDGGPPERRP